MSAQLAYAPTLWYEMFATVFNDHQPSTGAQRAARLRKKRPYLPVAALAQPRSGSNLVFQLPMGEARADELIE